MNYKTWSVEMEDGSHTIELCDDETAWGERSVIIDGQTRFRTRKGFVDLGRMFQFEMAGHRCSVRFVYRGIVSHFVPELLIGSRVINTVWDGKSLPLVANQGSGALDPLLFPPGSTSYKLWRFWWKDVQHRIDLYHAWCLGQLHVKADGETAVQGQRLIEPVTTLQIVVGGRVCTIRIQDFGMERLYECMIDREVIFSDANADTLLRGSARPEATGNSLLRPAASGPRADKEELLRPEQPSAEADRAG